MQAEEFVERVHLRVPEGDEETARKAIDVTLHALGGILPPEEARNLAAQLPSGVADATALTADQPGPSDPPELYDRVAARLGTEPPLAAAYAAAVVDVVRKAISDGEFRDVTMELPAEFDELVIP